MIDKRRRPRRRKCKIRKVSGQPAKGRPRFRRLSGKTLVEVQHRIGEMLLKFPIASKQLRHVRPIGTVVDYLRAEDLEDVAGREAAAFLIDFLTMKTPDLIEKWYGNDLEPADLIEEDE